MSHRFPFTRLSSLGAVILILIMVVMLYPVLPPEPQQVHAATRLGLHVTQEELNIWRQRRTDNVNGINGETYASIWDNRILPDANDFKNNQSHAGGDGHWAGWTGSGCYPRFGNPSPDRTNGQQLIKAAFVFLVTGDTSYADPVRAELLNQITQPGTDFSNSSKWCVENWDGNTFVEANWLMRVMHAYDYLNAGGYTGFTSQQKTNIVNC